MKTYDFNFRDPKTGHTTTKTIYARTGIEAQRLAQNIAHDINLELL
jgi:hypothetical protein